MDSAGTPTAFWIVFAAIVGVVMALDLGVFHRKSHSLRTREAIAWVSVWVTLAGIFNVGVWHWKGSQAALEFLTSYVVELGLSVDNIFVFVVIFSYFAVDPAHQHRVLFWGIVGAMAMRMIFIFVGIALVENFTWAMYVFGALLFFTGVKLFGSTPHVHPERNLMVRVARRFLPMTSVFHGERFFVRERGRLLATPLLLVLLVVESTDVVFAVDSVPAVLGITSDRFVAYTSNIFAILGLRAMYFVLVGVLEKFHFLKYGLSLVLVFIGAKMLLHHQVDEWIPNERTSSLLSLVVVAGLLGGSLVLSLVLPSPKKDPDGGGPPAP
jgi:tellurite resistance protein TerC